MGNTDNRFSMAAQSSRSPLAIVLVCILLAGAAIASYHRIPSNDFIYFDDADYITENPHIKDGLSWDVVKWAFTSGYAGNWHPLTWLSHALDIELFGLNPAGHHIVNLIFHILTTLLLFGFLRYTASRLWASAVVAALFALHPLHVESVAWAAERKDVLSAFFWMLTMWAWAFYSKKPGLWRYIYVAGFYALGLMSKPMLVTLPLVLILLDYWPLARFSFEPETRSSNLNSSLACSFGILKPFVLEKVPLVMMAVASSAVTLFVQQTAIVAVRTMDIPTRITNIFVSYGRYLWQMLWPTGLALLYPRPNNPNYAAAAAAVLLIIVVTVIAIRTAAVRRYLIVGWFWYLITLVPVIGIVHVGMQSHADRYTYIPLIGIFIVIAWAFAELCEKYRRLKPVVAAITVLILLSLGLWTARTTTYWKNDVTIFERTTAATNNNIMMMINLGDAYLWRGHLDQAQATLEKAIELCPVSDSYVVLAIVLRRKGQIAEAVQSYEKALELDPNQPLALLNAGILLHDLKKDQKAELYLRRAVELDPKLAQAHSALALVLAAADRLDEGITAARKAVELESGLASSRRVLASLLADKGLHEEASTEYQKSLELEPDYSAYTNLGQSLVELGRFNDAAASLKKAIALKPAEAEPWLYLSKALYGLGSRNEAINAIEKCLSLDPNYAPAVSYRRTLLGETR